MKKLLVLMLSVGVISQLSVTSLSASSQAPNGVTITGQIAAVQSAYNTYITAYNNLYAYAISSGSTYKKNIKAALISANTALASVNSSIAIDNYSVSNVPLAILNTVLNNCNTSLIPALNNVVSASSNASYKKYASSGNSNASASGVAVFTLGQNLVTQLRTLVTLVAQQPAVKAAVQAAQQAAQQAVQAAQQAVQATQQIVASAELSKEAQSALQSAQAALSQALSAQTLQGAQAAQQAVQAAQQASQAVLQQAQQQIAQQLGISSSSSQIYFNDCSDSTKVNFLGLNDLCYIVSTLIMKSSAIANGTTVVLNYTSSMQALLAKFSPGDSGLNATVLGNIENIYNQLLNYTKTNQIDLSTMESLAQYNCDCLYSCQQFNAAAGACAGTPFNDCDSGNSCPAVKLKVTNFIQLLNNAENVLNQAKQLAAK